jgi:hypothetical protein
MVGDKVCTVCGYEMEEGPRDYNICPSCGTEFGLHDVNSTVDNLRAVWLAGGAKWYSVAIPQPSKWNPIQQLAKLLFSQVHISPVYNLGTIMGETPVLAESDQAKFSYR